MSALLITLPRMMIKRGKIDVMRYPVDVLHRGGGFVVTCRDLPEAKGDGTTRESAIERCKDALIFTFDKFFANREAIPVPSEPGEDFIQVPCSVAAKVLLLNEVVRQDVTNAELARRMELPRQEITRIFNLSHATKIDTIQKALVVLGKRLVLNVY